MKHLRTQPFMAVILFLFSFISTTITATGIDTSRLIVKTKQGQVKGTTEQNICVWKGIRYAKAPAGELRYRAPQSPDSWTGIKDATVFGAVAPQMRRVLVGTEPQSEDCLSLNIWSPAADGKKRPVMVWIHGGGFVGGSGSSDLYDGTQIVKRGDVVVVTINYRLGPLGFLYFDSLPGSKGKFEDNLGIKDQVAALKWVKENIAAFGGDPEGVTLFGESAGGISVETLMAIPAAQGLFHRAIIESGPAGDVWTPKAASQITALYLKQVGVSQDSLFKLKLIPVDSITSAMTRLMKIMIADPTLPKTFAPTIDGNFLPHDLLAGIKDGQSKGIDLLIGTNKNEANLFAMKRLKMAPVNEEQLKPYITRFKPAEQKQLIAAYKNYPGKDGILDLITDGIFTMPSIKFAELQSTQANTYMYRFDWTSKPLTWVGLKACHGLEVPFVFNTFETKMGKKILFLSNNKKIHQISNQMQQEWINFARTGNPNAPGKDDWKKYEPATRTTLIYDKKGYICQDPKSTQRQAWGDLNIFE
jgi:para-nitrobenzyl esterase